MTNKIRIKYNIFDKTAKNSFIMLSISWSGNRIQLSTRLSIEEPSVNWNYIDCRVINTYSDANMINSLLNEYSSRIELFYKNEIAEKRTITKEILKQKIESLLDANKGQIEKNEIKEKVFFDWFDIWMQVRKKLVAANELKAESIKKEGTAQNHLKNFEKKKRIKVTFEGINKNFYFDFFDYLRKDVNLKDNSIGQIVKVLKIFMNWAFEEGLHNNLKYKKIKVLNIRNEPITLTIEELEALEILELPEGGMYDKARNLFLIQTYLCLRYFDLRNLTPQNFDLKHMRIVKLVSNKTNYQYPEIPITPDIIKILNKYPSNILPKMTNQVYNRLIKEICKKAKIESEVTVTQIDRGLQVVVKLPKYKMISSHSARRTGATLMYKSGYPIMFIMKLTGHKNIKTFQQYIGITDDDLTILQYGFDREKLKR